ncbi:MAG: hypothetical protein V3W41_16415 [Planctomycetota bacterium]
MTESGSAENNPLSTLFPEGFARACLHEVCLNRGGDGGLEALLPSLLSAVSPSGSAAASSPSDRSSSRRPGLCFWIAGSSRNLPYPPALADWGADLSRWVFLNPADRAGLWDALELTLASGLAELVVGVLDEAPLSVLRRLQVASRRGGGAALLIRGSQQAAAASAAPLRLSLRAEVALSPRRRRVRIEVFKRPGMGYSPPLSWEWGLDALDAPPHARLRDRSSTARSSGREHDSTRAFGA